MTLEQILAREFATRGLTVEVVTFHDDESIEVHTTTGIFRMMVGSDDDGFDFAADDGRTIKFEYPDDWFTADE